MSRTLKQIATDICCGDEKSKLEIEKIMGKPINKMSDNEKVIGLSCLSAFEKVYKK